MTRFYQKIVLKTFTIHTTTDPQVESQSVSDLYLLNTTEFIHGALVVIHTVLSQVEVG